MTLWQWIGIALMAGGTLALARARDLQNSGVWSVFGYTSGAQPDSPENTRPPVVVALIALLVSFAGVVMLVWPYWA